MLGNGAYWRSGRRWLNAYALAFLVASTPGCWPQPRPHTHRTAIPHLYGYDGRDLSDHVRALTGYDSYLVERNAAGTALYINLRSTINKIVIVSLGCQIDVLDRPARYVALDDSRQFVAWYSSPHELYFRNGHRQVAVEGPGFDPGGLYYFTKSAGGQTSIISKTDRPGVPLTQLDFDALKMFVKNSKLYVFGRPERTSAKEYQKLICHVFRIADSRLVLENTINVQRPVVGPSPFGVVDMDPWSPNVLLVDVRDQPGRSKWLLFNLDSRTITQVGDAETFGFFLKDDVFEGGKTAN